MNKVKPMLIEPAVFDDVIEAEIIARNLPNFVGHVDELDTTSQVFVEYASNVSHIKPFKVRMPLGWNQEIKPMTALPNKTDGAS